MATVAGHDVDVSVVLLIVNDVLCFAGLRAVQLWLQVTFATFFFVPQLFV